MTGGGIVDAPLGRHPVHRKKQAVNEAGKEAITHYKVINRYRSHTHVQLNLETGRTHQIRDHIAWLVINSMAVVCKCQLRVVQN